MHNTLPSYVAASMMGSQLVYLQPEDLAEMISSSTLEAHIGQWRQSKVDSIAQVCSLVGVLSRVVQDRLEIRLGLLELSFSHI